MAPRTREQLAVDRIVQENESLKAQLAFLGGAVMGVIDSGGSIERLERLVGTLEYLKTLPGFAQMMEARREKPFRPFSPEPHPNSKPMTLDDIGKDK